MNDDLKYEWVCEGCGKQYALDNLACSKCIKSKPKDPKLVRSKYFDLIEKYEKEGPSKKLNRIFSLTGRIGRIEFLICIIGWFVLLTILFAMFGNVAAPYGALSCSVFSYILLFLIAGKRTRDLNMNPWLGIPLVIFTFTLLVLLFMSGTNGVNRYGAALK